MDSAQAKSFADSLIAQATVAGWQIHECIGHGKSAVVMRATKANDVAALKVFHPELIERYGREAQLLRVERERRLIGVSHPNMVKILDAGVCETCDKMFVAMEYVEGVNLRSALPSIARTEIEAIVEGIARVAKFLEDSAIVHRDIKPENIVLRASDQSAVLLDFGVMRPVGDSSATDQNGYSSFVGTHQYCPTEMIHGRVEDTIEGWRAVSFYQLGALLFDLLTGKPLFDEYKGRIADLVKAIDEYPPILSAERSLSRHVALAKKCLLKNPAERLNLTTWNDFFFSENVGRSSIEARKKRLSDMRAAEGAANNVAKFDQVETARLANENIKVQCRALRTQVDRTLDGLRDQLPLKQVSSNVAVHPDVVVSCQFAGAIDKLFGYDFNFQFSLSLSSENAVEVFGRAGRGATPEEVGWSSIGLFLGGLEDLEEALSEWMLDILEELAGVKGESNE